MCRHAKQNGYALILILWVLALLSVMGLTLTRQVRVETRNAIWLSEQTQAEQLAQAGVYRAIIGLLDQNPDTRWNTDGLLHHFNWHKGRVAVRIWSESGRLALNQSPRDVLAGLIAVVAPDRAHQAVRLANAIVDWRDRDHRKRDGGAEDDDYRAAGFNYGAADGPFATTSELALVMGFDAELVAQITPFVTIYSRSPRIDPRSAPLEIIKAIPKISTQTAEEFIFRRQEALETDQPIPVDLLQGATRYLDLRRLSGLARIQAHAVTENGVKSRLEAIVLIEGENSYQILDWLVPIQGSTTEDETNT